MNETIEKAPIETDIPIRTIGWKNLYFMKDGSNSMAPEIWPSEKEAREVADKFIARGRALKFMQGTDMLVVHKVTGRIVFRLSKFSHHMQIPVTV